MRTILLTLLTLVAFAANSILCRMALKDGLIDPVGFTQLRLLSGAFVLAAFLAVGRKRVRPVRARDWRPALALFVYAIAFSLAYVTLDAAVGALILFAMVQISMIGIGLVAGARPQAVEWVGLVVAFAGLFYLVAPGLSAPPLAGAALMAVAGIAWGVYSVLGKTEAAPATATARNFILTLPFAALLVATPRSSFHAEPEGVALALASGALASGLGYVIWYAALKGLTNMAAAVVQLAVPVVAAAGAVVFLGETVTTRLAIASALILGGVFITVRASLRRSAQQAS